MCPELKHYTSNLYFYRDTLEKAVDEANFLNIELIVQQYNPVLNIGL